MLYQVWHQYGTIDNCIACMIFAIDQTWFDLQNYIFTNSLTDLRNIFLTVLVIVCACTSSDIPEDLINQEKMVEIMVEIHLLEAKINNILIDPHDSIQAVYEHYEKLLFQDLSITQDQYERSFNHYVNNSSDFEKIYNTVVDSLMAREQKLKK
ncbi:DUF4296 domain-containing protein [Ekhidna sp.]